MNNETYYKAYILILKFTIPLEYISNSKQNFRAKIEVFL